jgi:hypothetical protein
MFVMSRFLKSIIGILILISLVQSCKKDVEETAVVYNDYVTPIKIVDETFRIGARSTAVFSNKSIMTRTINFPKRTVYWSYWMGAGPEPVDALSKVILSAATLKLTQDPVVAYGWGILSSLPITELGKTNADLFFIETKYNDSFSFDNSTFQSFLSKPQTKNIHNKYIDIFDTPLDVNRSITVGLRNQSYLMGVDVQMKIWAFVVKEL